MRENVINPRSFRANSLLNLLGGVAMVLYSIAFPAILARILPPPTYSAYALGIQFVPFLALFSSPVQISLAPIIAKLHGKNDASEEESIFWAAVCLLALSSIVAFFFCWLATLILPYVLNWDKEFAGVAIPSMMILGMSTAAIFPVWALTAYAAGHRDNLWDNVLKVAGPYLALVILAGILVLKRESGDVVSSITVAVASAASLLVCAVVVLLVLVPALPRLKLTRRQWIAFFMVMKRQLFAASGVLWWQLCAILAVSAAPFIVSAFEPSKVAAYAVASSVMSIIAGVSSALAGPFSVKMADPNLSIYDRRALFLRLHRPFVGYLLFSTLSVLLLPTELFVIWVGPELGGAVQALLVPLALANLLRQATATFTFAVLGQGLQSRIWFSPAVEALTSIFAGLCLGNEFGAAGVAAGVAFGALCRLSVTMGHDLRITRNELGLSVCDFVSVKIWNNRG